MINKQEFLEELRKQLSGLPKDDIDERLAFYGEMIDDRIEEGLSEEEAVAGVGPIGEIVSQTVSDVPLTKIVKERVKPKRTLKGWEVALIILGFPLWFPLLIAAFAVIFSLILSLWSVVLSLWAVDLALLLSAAACLTAGLWMFFRGDVPRGLALTGAALVLAGLTVFLFFGCLAAAKGTLALARNIVRGLKALFLRKENTK